MTANEHFKVQYSGSVFWLVFWVVIFFPVGLVLMFTQAKFTMNGKLYFIEYDGSRFWLCFWTICFFPLAFVLALVNGFSVKSA